MRFTDCLDIFVVQIYLHCLDLFRLPRLVCVSVYLSHHGIQIYILGLTIFKILNPAQNFLSLTFSLIIISFYLICFLNCIWSCYFHSVSLFHIVYKYYISFDAFSNNFHSKTTCYNLRNESTFFSCDVLNVHPRLPKTAQYHPRSPKIAQDCPRSPKISQDHPRVPKNAQDHPRLAKITKDRPRSPKIAQDCPRLPKIAQGRPRLPKIT